MAYSTAVSICNLALEKLGDTQETITVLSTGTTTQAIVMNNHYSLERDKLLLAHPWKFATKVSSLSEHSTATSLEWERVYAVPADLLQDKEVLYDGYVSGTSDPVPYELYALSTGVTVLACDVEDAYLKYVYKITDTTKFSPEFIEALAYRLAAEAAIPLTGDAGVKKDMEQLAQINEAKAAVPNANKGNQKPQKYQRYIDGRK